MPQLVPTVRAGLLAVLLGSLLAVAVAAPPTAVAGEGGDWGWPLPGRPEVARPFAPGPTRYSAGHYGVDLAGPAGLPVLAAGAGRVSFAGLVAGRGVVVLEHPGTGMRTSYEPVDALVALGEEVDRGEVIGLLDPLGHACPSGTCLHWGLRRGAGEKAEYLDPLRLLVRPVRLLPRDGGPPVRPLRLGTDAASRGLPAAALPAEVVRALRVLLPAAGLLLPPDGRPVAAPGTPGAAEPIT